jgi:hypothetical protein
MANVLVVVFFYLGIDLAYMESASSKGMGYN